MIKITEKMRKEFEMREYHGDEFWNKTKRELDEMLAYRKTIKGKPDVYQKAMIELNAPFISLYKRMLFGT